MPPTFTTILAEHLARSANRPTREARRRRGDQCRHDLSRARRQAHDAWRAATAPRSSRSTTARRSISASRRSIRCFRPPPRSGDAGAGAGADRHGLRRPARRAGDRRGRRQRDRAGRSDQRRLGHAGPGRAGRPVLGGAAARPDRAAADAPVRGGARRDPARLRLSAQAAARALRPRAVGREAVSGRKPAAAGRAHAWHRHSRRTGGAAQAAPTRRWSPTWSRR